MSDAQLALPTVIEQICTTILKTNAHIKNLKLAEDHDSVCGVWELSATLGEAYPSTSACFSLTNKV